LLFGNTLARLPRGTAKEAVTKTKQGGCRVRRLRVVAVSLMLGCGLTGTFVAAARASEIVYGCGGNLCAINPDGTGQTQLTSDGQPGTAQQYGSPSISRDGATLAFVYNSHVFVGGTQAPSHAGTGIASTAFTAILRPDGQQLAELEASGGMVALCTYNIDGTGRNCPYGTGSAGWAPDNSLLISVASDNSPYNQHICDVPAAVNTACSVIKADDVSHDLFDPSVSPDGSTLAVTVANGPLGSATTGYIALYNYATGAFIRDLTLPGNTTDETPVWSPDGSQIAFTRGSSVYVTSANGSPGSEHQLVATGDSPTWGGGPGDSLPGGPDSTGGGGAGGSTGGHGHPVTPTCRVPKVIGKTPAGARRAIIRAGCKVGKVKKQRSKGRHRRRRRGTVLSEAPRAGKVVPRGTKVSLTLAG
jgi:hypothetical protein